MTRSYLNNIPEMKESELTTLSARLLYALKKLKVTQAELSRRVGLKPQTIQYICSNKARKSTYTYKIAEALEISGVWLANGEGSMCLEDDPEFQLIKSQHRIPLLDWHEVRDWVKNTGTSLEVRDKAQDWILTNTILGQKGFGLRLNDKSMYPRFEQNTVILVNPDKTPKNREFVVAYLKEIDGIVFRQYEMMGDAIMLKPINTSMYKPVNFNNTHDCILGVMLEARWQA